MRPAAAKPANGSSGNAGDAYARLMRAPIVGGLAKRAGLPRPVELERYRPGAPVIEGSVLLGAAAGGALTRALARTLVEIGAPTAIPQGDSATAVGAEADQAGLSYDRWQPPSVGGERFKALVFDASGIADSADLAELYRFFHPSVRSLGRNGRVIVLGSPPGATGNAREHTAQRALEGFTRALGKEVGRRGATAQLVYVQAGAEKGLDSTIRFLLSPRSAYVSGQVIRLTPPPEQSPGEGRRAIDWDRPLAGSTALVTGAARGIGAAIAEVLARDGARVVGLDVAAAGGELRALMARLGGEALELDITAADAPAAISAHFGDGLDVLVHNAGVTRDNTLAKMPEDRWSTLIEINLSSEERISEELLAGNKLRRNGRVVCVSSIAGLAGNAGQTNYSTSKAGVVGMVSAAAPGLAKEHGATINAVAPGFIETQMTASMPFAIREAGRRMNSLLQGGLPVDVAETIAWLANPASGALNGNVVRVCGQSLLGA
jgi:3-oxoacyl-[acyl-carrier protein] reductase